MTKSIAMGFSARSNRCDAICPLAVYLACDRSRFMTGSAVVIDGGAKL